MAGGRYHSSVSDRIQALRVARGWSQTELANRAGVTRQLVGALEAGRHTPNVAAALGLARALGASVEDLFASRGDQTVDVLDNPQPAGTPVRVVRVGDRAVTVADAHGVDGPEAWGIADAVTGIEAVSWLPGGVAADLLIAGCDPIIGILSGVVERSGHRMIGVHASTGRSVEALAGGRVHGILVHARSDDLPTPPVPVRRWRVASWQVGLGASSSRRTAPSIDELATRRHKVVQRDTGAGTQRALDRALRDAGAEQALPGPVGSGHIDVARRVSYGGVAAGVLMEAAAFAFGLRFTPLEQHAVELWIAEDWATLPAVVALLGVLNSEALIARSRLLGGYDPTGCGTQVVAS